MAVGLGPLKAKMINLMLDKPALLYIGGAAFLQLQRTYATKTTYNYWFGKIEFERRLERNQL